MEICFPVFCVAVEVVAKIYLHVLLTVHDGPVEGHIAMGTALTGTFLGIKDKGL